MSNLKHFSSGEFLDITTREAHIRDFRNVRDVVFGISNRFDENRLGLLIHSGPEISWVVGFNPLHSNAKLLQQH